MKIAIVHDYLREYGGAERVLEVLAEMFPEATIFTGYYRREKFAQSSLRLREIKTLPIQRVPLLWDRPNVLDRLRPLKLGRYASAWILALPSMFVRLDLSSYDLVISSTSYSAHHVMTRGVHIAYCHTPSKLLWQEDPNRTPGRLSRLLNRLRAKDLRAAQRVTGFIANSENVRGRIRDHYGRESAVVYPPVDLLERVPDFRLSGKAEDFYLVVSRLDNFKRVDVIIDAFGHIDKKVVIVGTGSLDDELRRRSGANVRFMGFVDDKELCDLYDRCTALIAAAEDEDFGITAVEAQLFGKPVIASRQGGFLETVIDGETGVLFDPITPESLIEAIERLERTEFDPAVIRANTARFSRQRFEEGIRDELAKFGLEMTGIGAG